MAESIKLSALTLRDKENNLVQAIGIENGHTVVGMHLPKTLLTEKELDKLGWNKHSDHVYLTEKKAYEHINIFDNCKVQYESFGI